MKSYISKILFFIGSIYRNPSLRERLHFLNESDTWDLEVLKKHQLEETKKFLEFAGKTSEYYKNLFIESGFDPSTFTSLDDLKKIPILDKKTLLTKNKEVHSTAKFKKLIFCETSGSSGEVLKFWRNEEWDSANRAAVFRGYSWYGVKPWERNGYLWGYNIDMRKQKKIKFLDALQNRIRVFTYQKEHVADFAKKISNARYLHGYSSMIYEIARIINKNGITPPKNIKMVKGTSEKIYPFYQKEVIKAFGKKLISEYGAAESGIIAFECPEGNMHIHMEGVIVERENGEILVTNFLSYSFPIIRYQLGDYIELEDENFQCPCGRKHPVIKEVTGRVGKNIVGKKGTYPSLTFYYVFKNLALESGIELNYQAVQERAGELIFNIEQDFDTNVDPKLKHEIEKYFKDDIDYTINYSQVLHKMDGKLRDFISKL